MSTMTDENTQKTKNKDQNNEESEVQNDVQDDVVLDTEDVDDSVILEENQAETIKKLREKIKTLEKEKTEYLTSWQKDKAEFVNLRRRDEESKQEFLKFAKQGIVEEILPVLDSFDMAMANKASWESASLEWRKGIENIYNQFIGILGKHSVTAFGAKGDVFDINLHHSIGMVKTENKDEDNKLAEILQKGYLMSGKTIRPALVKVWEM